MASPVENIEELAGSLSKLEITTPTEPNTPPGLIIAKGPVHYILSRWPKIKLRVPNIFLHKPVNFAIYVRELLSNSIQFYKPTLSRYYIRITCPSFGDQKAMVQFFDNKKLPYHTFGHPSKRKLKVVIRGLPKKICLDKLMKQLKSASIPIIRMHRLRNSETKRETSLILAVVPYNDDGKVLVKVKKVMGYDVIIEPPHIKLKQCYRCQLWGHTQRYCRGIIKCVKCAGKHFSKKCTRDSQKEPPKCANCGGGHTANYKQCPCCPESIEHKSLLLKKTLRTGKIKFETSVLVTLENYHSLYRNQIKKPRERRRSDRET